MLKNKIKTNESTFIAQGAKHRLHNPLVNTVLKIIEVQSGSYLGEDDIERFEDEFGRTYLDLGSNLNQVINFDLPSEAMSHLSESG